MVQVRVGQQHTVDQAHFVERQVAYAGSGIYQQLRINQEGGGPAVFGDGA
jgi:hypothetical protein